MKYQKNFLLQDKSSFVIFLPLSSRTTKILEHVSRSRSSYQSYLVPWSLLKNTIHSARSFNQVMGDRASKILPYFLLSIQKQEIFSLIFSIENTINKLVKRDPMKWLGLECIIIIPFSFLSIEWYGRYFFKAFKIPIQLSFSLILIL